MIAGREEKIEDVDQEGDKYGRKFLISVRRLVHVKTLKIMEGNI